MGLLDTIRMTLGWEALSEVSRKWKHLTINLSLKYQTKNFKVTRDGQQHYALKFEYGFNKDEGDVSAIFYISIDIYEIATRGFFSSKNSRRSESCRIFRPFVWGTAR